MRRALVLAFLAASACTSQVTPKNPYDPATPPELQAKAALRGVLSSAVLARPAGLQVKLRKDGVLQTPVDTDDTGLFVFGALVPGSYQLEIQPVGFVPVAIPVTLRPGQDLDVGTVELVPLSGDQGVVISGKVALEGATDLSGSLVEAVGLAYTAVTDSSGAFRLACIPGSFKLQFSHPSFKASSQDVTVVSGQRLDLPDDVLLYVNPAHVVGHVDAEQLDGSIAPLVDADVTVDGRTGLATTNASGDFTLDVPAGSYLVRVKKRIPGGASWSDVTLPVLNLEPGLERDLDPVTLSLARGGVSGRVVLADGGDPSGAVVEVQGTGRATVAGAAGDFQIDAVLVGTYAVTAHRDGYAAVTVSPIAVTEGHLAPAGTFTLARQGGNVAVVEAPYTTLRDVHLALAAGGVTHYLASEDASFQDAAKGDTDPNRGGATPWRAFSAGTPVPFRLADEDGAHAVYVIFSAAADGASPSAPMSAQVVLDRTAPVSPLLVAGDGSGWTRTTSGIVSLTLGALDLPPTPGAAVSGLGKMQLVNGDGSDWSGAVTFDYNASAAWPFALPTGGGRKVISARFLDRAGNVSAPVTSEIVVDTAAPSSASIALSGPDLARPAFTTSPLVTATLDALDANGGTGNVNLLVRLSNTPGFVGARYQPFASALTWVLTPGDGDKVVYAQFMDAAGNEGAPVSATIRLQTAGPVEPVLALDEHDLHPNNGYTNQPTVTLSLQALGTPVTAVVAENPALTGGTTYALAGQPVPYRPDHALVGADGVHTLWVRYYDAAGNASELASAAVVLDRTPPLAVVPAVTPAPFTASAQVTLTAPAAGQEQLQVSGAGVVASGWIDAAPGTAVPVTLSPGDGAKVFSVAYRDLADNVTSVTGPTLTLDGTPPTAAAFTVTGALADGTPSSAVTTSSAVVLALAATDAGAGVAEMMISESPTLQGASWQPFATAAAFALSPGDGPKVVYAKFRDAVGNVTPTASQGGIVLDATGPSAPSVQVLEQDSRQNGYTNNRAIQLVLNAGGAPVRALVAESPSFAGATAVTLGALPFTTPASGPGALALADADGAHTIWVRFVDAAGNTSDPAVAQVVLDRVGPAATAPAITPSPATGTSVSLTAPAAGQDEVQVTGAGTTGLAWTGAPAGAVVPFTLTSADGPKSLVVTWRDLADNQSAAIPVQVTLDTSAPGALDNFAIAGALADGTASTTVTATSRVTLDLAGASDAGTGLAAMLLSESAAFAGAAWQPYAAQAPFVLSAGDGPKTVYAKFRDAAGNTSASAVQGHITVDATGPTAPQIAIVETDGTQNGLTNATAIRLTLQAAGSPVRALVADNAGLAGAVTVAMPGSPYTTPTAVLALAAPDGTKTVYARFADAAGNLSDVASAQVVLDTTPPLALAPVLSATGFTGTGALTVTPPSAGQDELQVAVGGTVVKAWTAAPAGLPVPFTLPAGEGAKSVVVSYRDLAGNAVDLPPVTVTLDTTPPTAANFAVTGTLVDGVSTSATITARTAVTLDLSAAADAGSGLKEMMLSESASLAGASWVPYAAVAPFTLSTGDGTKTVYAKFRDTVGNASAAAVFGSIVLDTIGPASPGVSITETDPRQNGFTNNRAVTLTLSAAGGTRALVAENAALAGALAVTGPFSPAKAQPWTLADSDGSHTVYVQYFDAAGNPSSLATAQVTLDRLAPTATAPSIAQAPFAPGTSVTLVAPAAGQDDLMVAAGPDTPGLSWTPAAAGAALPLVLAAGDGPKTLTVTYRDAADNQVSVTGAWVSLDLTGPVAANFAVHGALVDGTDSVLVTSRTAVTLDFSAVGDGAGSGVKEMMISESPSLAGASWVPFTAAPTFALSTGDGAKTVYAKFRDNVGNASAPAVFGSISLDTAGPTSAGVSITESDSRQNGFTNSRAVTLTLSAGGAARALVAENAALAGALAVTGPFSPAKTQAWTLADTDGAHTLYVQYFDAAGNASGLATAQVVLDRVGPTATAPSISPSPFAPTTAVTLVAPAAGQDDLQVSGPGATAIAWTPAAPGAPIPVTLTAGDGAKSITVTYRDAADNTASVTGSWVTLDTVPPAASAFTVAGTLADGSASTTLTTTTAVVLDLSAVTDAGSGVEEMMLSETASLAGASWVPFNKAAAFTLTSGDATKTVYAKFRDVAGNATAAAVQGSITLDTTGPTAPAVTLTETDSRSTNGYTNNRNVMLGLSATGAARALVSESPSFVGATAVAGPFPKSAAFLLANVEGSHTVWVRYVDAAGNASDPATATVVLDVTAPSATAPTLSPATVTGSTSITLTPPSAGQAELQVTGAGATNTGWITATPGVAIPVTLASGDGAKAFAVTWRDLADNTSAALPLSIRLDGTAPVATPFSVTGQLADGLASGSITATTGVTLDLSGQSDGGSGSGITEMMLSNDPFFAGASWQPFVASTKVPWVLSPGDGTKIVYAKFRDGVSNTSGAAQGQIDLLASPPTGGTLAIEGGAAATNKANSQAVSIALSASGATEYRLTVDGLEGAWTAFTSPVTTSATLVTPLEGTKVVSALFRNAARVEGGGATASIEVDTVAPRLDAVAITGTLADSQTSTVYAAGPVVVAGVNWDSTDAGVRQIAFAEGASCATSFGGTWQPFAPSSTFVLSAGDGVKTLCARLQDDAGNVSVIRSASITLDTAAPPNPTFSNLASKVTNARTAGAIVAAIAADPLPATAYGYQCLGGQFGTAWTSCALGGGRDIAFTLLRNQENQLGVRTRDQAHNVSTGTTVTITQDDIAPQPPSLGTVTTTQDTLTVRWVRSPDADVADYLVYYGNSAGDLSGQGAAQGGSPVQLGSAQATQLVLTGLATGTPYYVSVAAVDRAGNVSVRSAQRVAVPNVSNPRMLASLGGQPRSVAIAAGNGLTFAYLAENLGMLQLDISSEVAIPTVTGRVPLENMVPNGVAPAVVPCTRQRVSGHCVVVAGTTLEGDYKGQPWTNRSSSPVVFFPATGGQGEVAALLPSTPMGVAAGTIDGVPVVVAAEADAVRFFSLANPDSPALLGSAQLSPQLPDLKNVDFTGTRVLVVGGGNVFGYDLVNLVAAGVIDERGLMGSWSGYAHQSQLVDKATGVFVCNNPPDCDDTSGPFEEIRVWDPFTHPNGPPTVYSPLQLGGSVAAVAMGEGAIWFIHGNGWAHHTHLSGPGTLGAITQVNGGANFALGSPRTGAVATVNGAEHLYYVRTVGTAEQLERAVGPAVPTFPGFGYREWNPDKFAVVASTVYVPDGGVVKAIDVSNPLRIVEANFVNGTPGVTYQSITYTGGLLALVWNRAAAPNWGVDLFWPVRGAAPRFITSLPGSYAGGVAVSGNHVFTWAGGGNFGLDAWTWSWAGGVGSATKQQTEFSALVEGLAARRETRDAGVTPAYALYTASQSGGSTFRTWVYKPGTKTFTAESAYVTLNGMGNFAGPVSVTLQGKRAMVSDSGATWEVLVTNPAAPVASTSINVGVAGRTVLTGGYLAGLAPENQPNGPVLATLGDGTVDGALPFSRCYAPGSYALEGTVAYASCHTNGLVISNLANPSNGRLVKQYGGVIAPGDGDGNTSWAADFQGNLVRIDETPNAVGPTTAPVATIKLAGKAAVTAFDGWGFGLGLSNITSYAIGTDGGWSTSGGSTVAVVGDWWNVPAHDGRRLYTTHPVGGGTQILAVDVTNPAAMSSTVGTTMGSGTFLKSLGSRLIATDGASAVEYDTTNQPFTLVSSIPTSAGLRGFAPIGTGLHQAIVYTGTGALGNDVAVVKDGKTTIFYTSRLNLSNPVLVGDILYVLENSTLLAFDMKPWLLDDTRTPFRLTPTSPDASSAYIVQLWVEGPFAYGIVTSFSGANGTYKAWDLR